MKINMLLSGCLLGLLCFTACDSEGNEMNDYTHYVNPFIGTGGHGHTHPGAMVPHGMIQPGPDTRIDGWDSCSGYYYEDTTINGFAHTRLSGTGCADFGDFLLMPTVGVQRTDFLGTESQKRPFASAFSHEKEYAEPGYYSVFLDTYGVKAELTSTERAAMHRYTFPESKESGFILDMDYNIQQQINQVMEVEGYHALCAAVKLAEKYGVELPITEAVYSVLINGVTTREAMHNLMTRDMKSELE